MSDILVKEEFRTRKSGKRDRWGLYICEKHGEYWQTVSNHNRCSGCRECNREAHSKARHDQMNEFPEWLLNEVSEEDKARLINKEVHMTDKLQFYCDKHGWYEQKLANHIYRKTGQPHMGCPKCVSGGYRSKTELQVEEFCKIMGWKLGPRRGILREGMELDIYLPEYSVAIEVDGSPWHTEGTYDPKGRFIPVGYHEHKDDLASEVGIDILHLTDGDWCLSDRAKNYKTKQKIINFIEEHKPKEVINE